MKPPIQIYLVAGFLFAFAIVTGGFGLAGPFLSPDPMENVGVYAMVVGFALAEAAVGWALIKRKSWARFVFIALCALLYIGVRLKGGSTGLIPFLLLMAALLFLPKSSKAYFKKT